MKITNQDKYFISNMIEYFEKLFPITDSAEFQATDSKLEELTAKIESSIDSGLYLDLDDLSDAMMDITSDYYFILGMKAHRTMQFMLDNPSQTIDLLYGIDVTTIY